MQKTPYIDVRVPNNVTHGDMMEIYAKFIDTDTLKSVLVPKVYLQIISVNDHEYWKTALMKQNVSVLHIAISTLEMRYDQYIIKISDHKEMTSFGFNKVNVRSFLHQYPRLWFAGYFKLNLVLFYCSVVCFSLVYFAIVFLAP